MPACIRDFAQDEHGYIPDTTTVQPAKDVPAYAARATRFCSACTISASFVSLSSYLAMSSSHPRGNPLYPIALISPAGPTATAPTFVLLPLAKPLVALAI